MKKKKKGDPVCARKTSNNEDTFVWILLEARTLDCTRIRSNRSESKVFCATRDNILVQRLIVFTWITGGFLVRCIILILNLPITQNRNGIHSVSKNSDEIEFRF